MNNVIGIVFQKNKQLEKRMAEEERDEESDFTHIGLKKLTKKKIMILTKILGGKQFRLLQIWTDDAWALAKRAGLVTDAMLEVDEDTHWVGMDQSDKEGMQRLVDKLKKDKGKK